MNTASLGWQRYAACRAADPDLFFAPEAEPAAVRQRRERRAKAICARCPVRQPCLDSGLMTSHGLWGVLSELDRERLKRREQLRRRAQREEIAS